MNAQEAKELSEEYRLKQETIEYHEFKDHALFPVLIERIKKSCELGFSSLHLSREDDSELFIFCQQYKKPLTTMGYDVGYDFDYYRCDYIYISLCW